ncbi:MAG: ABC-2 family transporter protein [Bacilli bacterium]|nr:ABC-2 family transporter protein [Bacilli bacterium]
MKQNPFKKYFAFIKGGILQAFSYKFSIFGWIIGDFIQILILCFLWIAVYKYSPTTEINGFTMPLMLTYLISARIVSQLVFSGDSFWQIGEDIRYGYIANNLIRPINYRKRLMAMDIGSFCGVMIIAFLPVYIISITVLHFVIGVSFPTWYNIILFLISSLASLLIISSFNFIIGQLAFYTGALFGIGIIKNEFMMFLSGGYLPIAFFPEQFQTVLNILPFTSILQTPNFIIMGSYTVPDALIKIIIQFGWVVVFNLLAALTFKGTIKHVTSVGG